MGLEYMWEELRCVSVEGGENCVRDVGRLWDLGTLHLPSGRWLANSASGHVFARGTRARSLVRCVLHVVRCGYLPVFSLAVGTSNGVDSDQDIIFHGLNSRSEGGEGKLVGIPLTNTPPNVLPFLGRSFNPHGPGLLQTVSGL